MLLHNNKTYMSNNVNNAYQTHIIFKQCYKNNSIIEIININKRHLNLNHRSTNNIVLETKFCP